MSQAGLIIGTDTQKDEVSIFVDFAPNFISYDDRSVLVDDAVYYIHEGEILTSLWGQTQ